MNLLAHAHLGLNHGPTVNTVNVLWDFICRDYLTSDDATILAGRSLHQEIDRLADQSAFFFETSKQLSPQRRRAARLLIDLFSDYFLAQHWDRFCEQPLDDFLERLVPSLQEEARHMSPRAKLIAQRIERFAGIVGADRVIAGSDCGFGTFAGFGAVDPEIAYAKLTSLAEGAALASSRL